MAPVVSSQSTARVSCSPFFYTSRKIRLKTSKKTSKPFDSTACRELKRLIEKKFRLRYNSLQLAYEQRLEALANTVQEALHQVHQDVTLHSVQENTLTNEFVSARLDKIVRECFDGDRERYSKAMSDQIAWQASDLREAQQKLQVVQRRGSDAQRQWNLARRDNQLNVSVQELQEQKKREGALKTRCRVVLEERDAARKEVEVLKQNVQTMEALQLEHEALKLKVLHEGLEGQTARSELERSLKEMQEVKNQLELETQASGQEVTHLKHLLLLSDSKTREVSQALDQLQKEDYPSKLARLESELTHHQQMAAHVEKDHENLKKRYEEFGEQVEYMREQTQEKAALLLKGEEHAKQLQAQLEIVERQAQDALTAKQSAITQAMDQIKFGQEALGKAEQKISSLEGRVRATKAQYVDSKLRRDKQTAGLEKDIVQWRLAVEKEQGKASSLQNVLVETKDRYEHKITSLQDALSRQARHGAQENELEARTRWQNEFIAKQDTQIEELKEEDDRALENQQTELLQAQQMALETSSTAVAEWEKAEVTQNQDEEHERRHRPEKAACEKECKLNVKKGLQRFEVALEEARADKKRLQEQLLNARQAFDSLKTEYEESNNAKRARRHVLKESNENLKRLRTVVRELQGKCRWLEEQCKTAVVQEKESDAVDGSDQKANGNLREQPARLTEDAARLEYAFDTSVESSEQSNEELFDRTIMLERQIQVREERFAAKVATIEEDNTRELRNVSAQYDAHLRKLGENIDEVQQGHVLQGTKASQLELSVREMTAARDSLQSTVNCMKDESLKQRKKFVDLAQMHTNLTEPMNGRAKDAAEAVEEDHVVKRLDRKCQELGELEPRITVQVDSNSALQQTVQQLEEEQRLRLVELRCGSHQQERLFAINKEAEEKNRVNSALKSQTKAYGKYRGFAASLAVMSGPDLTGSLLSDETVAEEQCAWDFWQFADHLAKLAMRLQDIQAQAIQNAIAEVTVSTKEGVSTSLISELDAAKNSMKFLWGEPTSGANDREYDGHLPWYLCAIRTVERERETHEQLVSALRLELASEKAEKKEMIDSRMKWQEANNLLRFEKDTLLREMELLRQTLQKRKEQELQELRTEYDVRFEQLKMRQDRAIMKSDQDNEMAMNHLRDMLAAERRSSSHAKNELIELRMVVEQTSEELKETQQKLDKETDELRESASKWKRKAKLAMKNGGVGTSSAMHMSSSSHETEEDSNASYRMMYPYSYRASNAMADLSSLMEQSLVSIRKESLIPSTPCRQR